MLNFDQRVRAAREPAERARQGAVQQLALVVPGARVDFDEVLGSPVFIGSRTAFLTGSNGSRARSSSAARALAGTAPAPDALAITRAFVEEYAGLFGHGGALLDEAVVQRDFVTAHNGLRTVVWAQRLDGIPIFESLLISHTTKNGELVNVSSRLVPNPAGAAGGAAQSARLVAAREAVALAAANVGETQPIEAVVAAGTRGAFLAFRASAVKGEAAVQKTWLPMSASELRLCWEVIFTSVSRDEMFRVLIDATSGEPLIRQSLTEHISNATYRVFTSDSPSPFTPGHPTPLTNQPPLVSQTLVVTNAYDTNASPNGWINDGDNETLGNNVDAHLDRDNDNLPDLPRPQGSPFRVFDFPLDLTQSPLTNQSASVVQLFFWCNWMHDQLYGLGFTEAAGNFQQDNFGRGGAGGDPVQADAQDGGGSNNANFSTPPDGLPPRMQMYLWTSVTPNRDGSFDAEVVLHEYTHGLSNRRVGGGVGLSAIQSRGMGEGWSDYYALSLLSEPTDDPNAVYAVGGYATFRANFANYYYGIRRYPYTTDLTKNPLTFKDIDPVRCTTHSGVPVSFYGEAGEVHNSGELWCLTLWEARANLIATLGSTAGNRLMLQLVTDGMNLAPPNPTFLQARDAILQAELVNSAGTHSAALWSAFAKRGLGVSATCPPATTTIGVCESFDGPGDMVVTPFQAIFLAGTVGGPFTPPFQVLGLTNSGTDPISWSAGKNAAWADLSATSGILTAGQGTTVTLSLNAAASNLVTGYYLDTLRLTNLTSGTVFTLPVELSVTTFASVPFTETWESGPIAPCWVLSGSQSWRSQRTSANTPHGGSIHLTLDSSGSLYSINEVTLGLNLAGCTNVVLQFWAKEFTDEADFPVNPVVGHGDFDGVAISEDGLRWYEAQALRSLSASYVQLTVPLDDCLRQNGLHYTSAFRVRFNHYDNSSIAGGDGMAIDDVSVTARRAGELDHFDWSPVSAQTSGIPFLVTLVARDGFHELVTNYTNVVAFTARSGPTNLTLFADNFEDGSFSDWAIGSAPYVRAVTNETAALGTNSLTLIGGTGTNHYNGLSHALAGWRPNRINFRVRTAARDKSAGYFAAGTGPSSSSMAIFFFMNSSGNMGLVEDVGGLSHVVPYQSNQWYKISLALDWSNKLVDFYVDDVVVERNIPFRNQSVSSLTQLYLYNFHFTQSWWDEIELLTSNTPAALSIFPTNSGSFVNGVWTGYVVVQPAGTNVFLTATDASAHAGASHPFVLAPLTDTDGDGMPDDWETAYNLDANSPADAGLDADDDGMSNLQEYRAGTNPRDSSDALRILSAVPSGADLQVTFTTAAARYYRLERSTELGGGVWSLVTNLIPGTGSPVGILVPGGAGLDKAFYRVRLLP